MELKINVFGNSGSGKTTFFLSLYHALNLSSDTVDFSSQSSSSFQFYEEAVNIFENSENWDSYTRGIVGTINQKDIGGTLVFKNGLKLKLNLIDYYGELTSSSKIFEADEESNKLLNELISSDGLILIVDSEFAINKKNNMLNMSFVKNLKLFITTFIKKSGKEKISIPVTLLFNKFDTIPNQNSIPAMDLITKNAADIIDFLKLHCRNMNIFYFSSKEYFETYFSKEGQLMPALLQQSASGLKDFLNPTQSLYWFIDQEHFNSKLKSITYDIETSLKWTHNYQGEFDDVVLVKQKEQSKDLYQYFLSFQECKRKLSEKLGTNLKTEVELKVLSDTVRELKKKLESSIYNINKCYESTVPKSKQSLNLQMQNFSLRKKMKEKLISDIRIVKADVKTTELVTLFNRLETALKLSMIAFQNLDFSAFQTNLNKASDIDKGFKTEYSNIHVAVELIKKEREAQKEKERKASEEKRKNNRKAKQEAKRKQEEYENSREIKRKKEQIVKQKKELQQFKENKTLTKITISLSMVVTLIIWLIFN